MQNGQSTKPAIKYIGGSEGYLTLPNSMVGMIRSKIVNLGIFINFSYKIAYRFLIKMTGVRLV